MKKLLVMSFIMASVMFSFAEIGTRTMDGNIEVQDNNTETFKVYGNCGMCKSRIESTLKTVEGIKSAKWDVDSKMITVTFDSDKITLLKINEIIAAAGHDTDKVQAVEKVYNGLPGCCKYDRAASKDKSEKSNSGHNHCGHSH